MSAAQSSDTPTPPAPFSGLGVKESDDYETSTSSPNLLPSLSPAHVLGRFRRSAPPVITLPFRSSETTDPQSLSVRRWKGNQNHFSYPCECWSNVTRYSQACTAPGLSLCRSGVMYIVQLYIRLFKVQGSAWSERSEDQPEPGPVCPVATATCNHRYRAARAQPWTSSRLYIVHVDRPQSSELRSQYVTYYV